MNRLLVIVFACVLSSGVMGEGLSKDGKPLTKGEIDRWESLQDGLDDLDRLEHTLTKFLKVRGNNCLKAFGHKQFCECVNEKLNIGVSFEGYIYIITNTKEEIGYEELSDEPESVALLA